MCVLRCSCITENELYITIPDYIAFSILWISSYLRRFTNINTNGQKRQISQITSPPLQRTTTNTHNTQHQPWPAGNRSCCVDGPYEAIWPPPLAVDGFIESQHPTLLADGGDWHEECSNPPKRSSGFVEHGGWMMHHGPLRWPMALVYHPQLPGKIASAARLDHTIALCAAYLFRFNAISSLFYSTIYFTVA